MLNDLAIKFQKYAPLFLRLGLAAVFVLFGIKKMMDPGQATSELQLLINLDIADAAAMNYYLGLVELIIAGGFILGWKVRPMAVVSSLLLAMFFLSFLTKYGLSINPDLYRDIGLLGASIALFLLGAGPWSVDARTQHGT